MLQQGKELRIQLSVKQNSLLLSTSSRYEGVTRVESCTPGWTVPCFGNDVGRYIGVEALVPNLGRVEVPLVPCHSRFDFRHFFRHQMSSSKLRGQRCFKGPELYVQGSIHLPSSVFVLAKQALSLLLCFLCFLCLLCLPRCCSVTHNPPLFSVGNNKGPPYRESWRPARIYQSDAACFLNNLHYSLSHLPLSNHKLLATSDSTLHLQRLDHGRLESSLCGIRSCL